MRLELTARQEKLLEAIINEFMDTAEAVGSINLPEKYDLGVSPATVRNEMMNLVKQGLLEKPHSSSGRIPTALGVKYFIEQILSDFEELSTEFEVRTREAIYHDRFSVDRILFNSVRKLAEVTRYMGFGIYEDRVFYAGVPDMIDLPEYASSRVLKSLMRILESPGLLIKLFERSSDKEGVKILVGKEDIDFESFDKAAIVYDSVRLPGGIKGYLGVIGPYRMDYAVIIPALKWMKNTVDDCVRGW